MAETVSPYQKMRSEELSIGVTEQRGEGIKVAECPLGMQSDLWGTATELLSELVEPS